jgi:hypothetical protein
MKSSCCDAELRKRIFGQPQRLKVKFICSRCGNAVMTPDTSPHGWRYVREGEIVRGVDKPAPGVVAVAPPQPSVKQ